MGDDIDPERIDDAVLALLWLGLHDGWRAWRGFDWAVSQFAIQAAANPLALAPRARAILYVLGGKHTEAEVLYRIRAERSVGMTAGRVMGSHAEYRRKPADAVATARRLRAEGYMNVEISDAATDEPCDEAELERAAQTEGG